MSRTSTSGTCTLTVVIDAAGAIVNVTGKADYTAYAGEPATWEYPGSDGYVEFTGFSTIEIESRHADQADVPDNWVYTDCEEDPALCGLYDGLALNELQDDPDKYAGEACEDAAERDEDTRW